MSTFLEFTLGSCWDVDLYYFDEDGVAEDVTNDTFTVIDARPEVIAEAFLTKTEPLLGKVHLHLEAEYAAELRVGQMCTFRVSRLRDSDHVENTKTVQVRIT